VPEPTPPAAQQCGRCRRFFEGDATLHPDAQPEWWLCVPCRVALFGAGQSPPSGAHHAS